MESLHSSPIAISPPVSHSKYFAPAVALILAATLRAFYSILAAFAVPHLLLLPSLIHSNLFTENLPTPADGVSYSFLGVWQRFDTLNYIHIAQFGYDQMPMVVFYPLYPLLIRLLAPVFHDPLVAALLISTIATFFLFWGLLLLVRLDFGERVAIRTVLFYALWPASFILFCGYAESLVLALIVWSIYFAKTGRWWLAGLLGCVAPLARIVGALVVPVFAVLVVRERRWRNLWAALPLLGVAAYPLWLHFTEHLLPWQAYRVYWLTRTAWPWITVAHTVKSALGLLDLSHAVSRLQLGAMIGVAFLYLLEIIWAGIVIVFALSKKLRLEYFVYSLAAIYMILSKDSAIGQQQWTRYVLILFPAAISFSLRVKDRLLFVGCTMLCFAINLLLMWFFLQWLLVV